MKRGFQDRHSFLQVRNFLRGGQAQTFQSTRHAVFKEVLQSVNFDANRCHQACAQALRQLVEMGGCLMDFFLRSGLRLTLKGQSFFDQSFKGFAALFSGLRLCLGHGAKAR